MPIPSNCLSGLLACSLVLTGGLFGVSQKDYDALKAENEALKAQLEAVRTEYADFVNRTPAAIAELVLSGADLDAELAAAAASTQYVGLNEAAHIETEFGTYWLTVLNAQFLPAESWMEDRYVISFELYNENFDSGYGGVTLYAEDFQLFDADGYLCSALYSTETLNMGQTVPPGKRCISQAVYRASDNLSEVLEFSFPNRNVVFTIPVDKGAQ